MEDKLKYYGQFDEIVRQEVNVKEYVRHIAETDKGNLEIVWDGQSYRLVLDNKDITSDRLLETIVLPALSQIHN